MDDTETKTRDRQHKLLVQIGIITIVIFTATLTFTAVSDYIITRRSYLTAKQEMIDRDLKSMKNNMEDLNNEWLFPYFREHADELLAGPSEEEQEFRVSERYEQVMMRLFSEGGSDPDSFDDIEKRVFARSSLSLGVMMTELASKVSYDKAYVLDFIDENEAYYYFDSHSLSVVEQVNPTGWEATSTDALPEDTHFLSTISYPASRHSAVKEMLKDRDSLKQKTYYEVYHDSENGKDYYIGYTPYILNGKVICYFALQYDWSDFLNELVGHLKRSILIGLLVLLALNSLLMLYLYNKAIKPAQKVKEGVQTYMEDKNSEAVCEKMRTVKTKNEIGVLAKSFSDLATEIDRYTAEIMHLTDEKARISAELDLATRIQADMLPSIFPAFPTRKEFDLYASMTPAKEVGGDFYDFFIIDPDHLGLVIADVSGKGIPAAMFMMVSKNIVANNAMLGKSPAQILHDANNAIIKNNSENMFVTVWIGILEISTGILRAANGGHEYPILKRGDQFELFKEPHGIPLGFMDDSEYEEYVIEMKPGDKLFVYTDGVPEATAADQEMFGTDRTLEVLNRDVSASPEQMLKNIKEGVDAFVKDAVQFDDLTMLALEYRG